MRIAMTTVVLFLFWCVVAPPEGWVDLAVGLAAAVALSLWSARFLWPEAEARPPAVHPERVPAFALLLGYHIVVAAAQVLRIVFDPRLPIAPRVLTQQVAFEEDAARVVYANAITITPGTLTLDVEGDTFVVHTLDPRLAADVVDRTLARDVARLFERRVRP